MSVAALCCAVFLSLTACKREDSLYDKDYHGRSAQPDAGGFGDSPVSADFATAFTPDYGAAVPEESSVVRRSRGIDTSAAGGSSASIIPGLRKLTEYRTVYTARRGQQYYSAASGTGLELPEEEGDLVISGWGPQQTVRAASEMPVFYVEFSLPVRSLTALEKPDASSDYMSITPPIAGVFRWYGTQMLSFEASEHAEPGVSYTITVKDGVRSLGGKELQGERVFRTKAEEMEFEHVLPAWTAESLCSYDSGTGLKPDDSRDILVRLNYRVTLEQFREALSVTYGEGTGYSDYSVRIHDAKDGKSEQFVITMLRDIPRGTEVTLRLGGHSGRSFHTLRPFRITGVEETTRASAGGRKNPLTVSFNQLIDTRTLSGAIHVQDKETGRLIPVSAGQYVVEGDTLRLHDLPLQKDKMYSVRIAAGVMDIYGQELSNPDYENEFRLARIPSYARFLESGSKILEAQFPHKLLFEYQNVLPGSGWALSRKENPLPRFYGSSVPANEHDIDSDTRDTRLFEEVDLEPCLDNGRGWVEFTSRVNYMYYDWYDKTYKPDYIENRLQLQVTDLGVTARIGINRAAVLVTSLATGMPVADAQVVVRSVNRQVTDLSGDIIAEGRTDSEGFAVLDFDEPQAAKVADADRHSDIAVYVEKGGDRTIFLPSSHYSWRNGVRSSSIEGALSAQQRTFLFVDRGIYRPGETVTFRGIDRDQLFGVLSVHKGDYSVTLREPGWRGKVIQTLEGTLSENGGFHGSFRLPDDLEPSTYHIEYKRGDSSDGSYEGTISFTVAEFERAKFQAAVTIPSVTYFAGDSIPAAISAGYLAGGSLGGAEFRASWFKSPVRYEPSGAAAAGYRFGPDNYYEGRDYYSEDKGTLSGSGTASISSTAERTGGGRTYRYRVEAAITDTSNQRIVAEGSALVHPARFYIGVGRPAGTSGFVKANTRLGFPFLLCTPDGTPLDGTKAVSELRYTLSHESWTMVQEQAVNGSVYTRYKQETVIDDSASLRLSAKGTISVTPKEAGWYTLRVTGRDTDGNEAVTDYGFYATGSSRYSYWRQDSDILNLTPDQSMYNPGDTAHVLLESPLPEGTYLVTVERDGIFTEELRHFDMPASVIDIKIARNYMPVVYVSVSSFSVRAGEPAHKYGEPDMDKPNGFYGVCALKVNPNIKAFSVDIAADRPSYRPGDTATLTVRATKGGVPLANAELTVMAADRGVLDLINYHVDDPIAYFYDSYNFPLRVQGGDNRSMLMDPVTYSVKNLQGGDSDADTKEDERRDFRATALFEPEVRTGADGTATVTFTVPDSLTTYRVTAFGVKEDLFALSEDEILVRNPINVQQVQPRRLRVDDTAEAGVIITNLEPTEQTVSVSLAVRSPDGDTAEDELAGRRTVPGKGFVDGDAGHSIRIASGGTAGVYFDVAATEPGTVELVYTIKSDVLSERLVSPIRIERDSAYVYETVTMTGAIDDEKKDDSVVQKFMIPGIAKDGRGDLSITLDATRLGLLGSSVQYVFNYPHGCMEQQSSRVLPLVIFGDYIDVFGLESEVSDAKKCAVSFMREWRSAQLPDGGFPYWPDGTVSNGYVSARILHIAAVARQRGYSERDIGFDTKALADYVSRGVGGGDSGYCDAYACYALALYGDKSVGTTAASLHRSTQSVSTQAMLALALHAAGNGAKAREIAAGLQSYMEPAQRSVTVRDVFGSGYGWWYESDTAKLANLLQLYVTLEPDGAMADRLLYTLLQKQSTGGYWHNTSDTARVLEAVSTLIRQRRLDKTNLTATVLLGGMKKHAASFRGVGAKPSTIRLPFEDEFVAGLARDTELPVEFTKSGAGHLYYTMEMRYALPVHMQAARDEGIRVECRISDFDSGEEVRPASRDSALIELTAGKLYKAQVTVYSPRNRSYLALRAPVPSGAEILDSTLASTGSAAAPVRGGAWQGGRVDRTVLHDNEADYYWDNYRSGEAVVNYTFRAARRGVYPTPSAYAECMYEPEIFGRGDGYLFVIK